MSDIHETTTPSGSDDRPADTAGKVETAKQEAADLKDTATAQAKDVVGTAKQEAGTVVGEAKSQVKSLYAQTRHELQGQAHTQQQRVSEGLRSVSDELGSMAANSQGTGVAGDLVQQVSGRLGSAATWLGDRDPNSVLSEVKQFARRRPGTFILGAFVVGVAVGRLTRALAANASDEKSQAPAALSATPSPATPASPAVDVWAPSFEVAADGTSVAEVPGYGQPVPPQAETVREGFDDRRHTL